MPGVGVRVGVLVPVGVGVASVNAVEIRSGLQTGDLVILTDMTEYSQFDRIRME